MVAILAWMSAAAMAAAPVAADGSAPSRVPGALLLGAASRGFQVAVQSLRRLEADGHLGNLQPAGIADALVYSLRHWRLLLQFSDGGGALAEIAQAEKALQADLNLGLQAALPLLERLLTSGAGAGGRGADIALTLPAPHWSPGAARLGSNIQDAVVELGNGVRMPLLGLGTGIFHVPHAGVEHAVLHAARELGYRHFDCAQNYGTEDAVGRGLRASGVPRAELFVATKLSQLADYGSEETPRLVRSQLARLGVDYVDLYMLHGDLGDATRERQAWGALERLHALGTIRALGLSNYGAEGVSRIRSFAKVHPAVLQIKYDVYHPGFQRARSGQTDLVGWAQAHGLFVVGYSTLSGWPSVLRAADDAHVAALAAKYGRTPAQLLLRHSLQKGIAVIPSSANEHRLRANTRVFDFEIAPGDVALLDGLAHFVSLAEDGAPSWLPDVCGARAAQGRGQRADL